MAVIARIGGSEAGDSFTWVIEYDDATRAVTTSALGSGFAYASVQITASVTRTVAYFPVGGGTSRIPELAALMAAADFTVTADGQTVTLASNIPPAQVTRIVGKAGSALGGFPSTSQWARA